MGALIYNSTAQAFQESATPKVYNSSAWQDSAGKVWNGSEWEDAWPESAIEPVFVPTTIVGDGYTLGGMAVSGLEIFSDTYSTACPSISVKGKTKTSCCQMSFDKNHIISNASIKLQFNAPNYQRTTVSNVIQALSESGTWVDVSNQVSVYGDRNYKARTIVFTITPTVTKAIRYYTSVQRTDSSYSDTVYFYALNWS